MKTKSGTCCETRSWHRFCSSANDFLFSEIGGILVIIDYFFAVLYHKFFEIQNYKISTFYFFIRNRQVLYTTIGHHLFWTLIINFSRILWEWGDSNHQQHFFWSPLSLSYRNLRDKNCYTFSSIRNPHIFNTTVGHNLSESLWFVSTIQFALLKLLYV